MCALQHRRPGHWHPLVFDRSALFSNLKVAESSPPPRILSSHAIPLVTHLRHILVELQRAWSPLSPKPSWRLHQELHPSLWNVSHPLNGKLRSFSRIGFLSSGLVGVDIRSHQSDTCLPFPVLVTGNEAQDAGCTAAQRLQCPPDVMVPSGGPFAWFSHDSRMVTSPIRSHTRNMLREQSTAAWRQRPVQGLVPRLAQHPFQPALDPTLYVRCKFPPSGAKWCLPSDTQPVDLSPFVFRLHRAIGGIVGLSNFTHSLRCSASLLPGLGTTTCRLCVNAPFVRMARAPHVTS